MIFSTNHNGKGKFPLKDQLYIKRIQKASDQFHCKMAESRRDLTLVNVEIIDGFYHQNAAFIFADYYK